MKFSTPFTLAATTLFMMGSTDAHLRGQRSLETTDDNGGDCTGVDEDPCPDRDKDPWACIEVPCCAGLEEQLNNWDQDGYYYYKCMDKDASKPIPKKELKCSGSDYVKCLTGYIRPYDGVWVLDDYAPWGPKDPKCINWPQTSEQLCNECAGGNIIIIKKNGSIRYLMNIWLWLPVVYCTHSLATVNLALNKVLRKASNTQSFIKF